MLTNIKSKKTKTFLLFILAILSVICIPKIIKKVTIKKYTYKIIPKEKQVVHQVVFPFVGLGLLDLWGENRQRESL